MHCIYGSVHYDVDLILWLFCKLFVDCLMKRLDVLCFTMVPGDTTIHHWLFLSVAYSIINYQFVFYKRLVHTRNFLCHKEIVAIRFILVKCFFVVNCRLCWYPRVREPHWFLFFAHISDQSFRFFSKCRQTLYLPTPGKIWKSLVALYF